MKIDNVFSRALADETKMLRVSPRVGRIEVALLTGGYDKPYVSGLTQELASKNIRLDVIGGDEIDSPEMHTTPGLRFMNLRRTKGKAGLLAKTSRLIVYYVRLAQYAANGRPKIFHILWNNKFEILDRTLLMLYYRLLGKKITFTAHNVNAGRRDGGDSQLNRVTLWVQYRLCDHIFVHTEKMKDELLREFGVRHEIVSVIPFGINNSVPNTALTSAAARSRLGIKRNEKVILFFGTLRPYKGLEYLVNGFLKLARHYPDYRLVIAGERRKESGDYPNEVLQYIEDSIHRDQVMQVISFIPDEEAEVYFKAADVLALPYTHVFQSGVLFTAYAFGLPVVATDVGSIREEIVEGDTGFLCRPRDSADLASALERYFESDLFKNLDQQRQKIRAWANARHSWNVAGETTCRVYAELSTSLAIQY